MKPIRMALMASALLALTASSCLAQYVVSAKSGTVNFTEGQVQLDGQPVQSSITHYAVVQEGSVLRTADGRAEVLLTPGVTLRLGDHASLKMITNRLIDTRLELLGGSAVVEAGLVDKDTSVTVVVGNAAVSLPKAGIYRFNFDPAQVKVFKGEAAVLAGMETTLVGAGRMCALGGTTAAVEKFGTEDTDALDHWSHRRGELMSMANTASANAYNSGGGSYGGYYMGVAMPMTGCSNYGNMMMPGFGYGGSLWSFFSPYAGYTAPGFWSYNCWYGMYTYMPLGGGTLYGPYGYPYVGPAPVKGSPTAGPVVKRPPIHGPIGGPVTLAQRRPLTLAVNGFHAPGFRGMGFTHSYGTSSSGYRSFASGGPSFAATASSSTSVSTPSVGFSGAVASRGGASSGAVSSGGGGGGHR